MGAREELEHKTKISIRKKHTAYTPDFTAIELPSLCVTQTDTNICSHTLFFSNNSSHKPPDINIFKNINMTIHKSAHSSNVFTWHQKWERHCHTCWLPHIYLLGHKMDTSMTNNDHITKGHGSE